MKQRWLGLARVWSLVSIAALAILATAQPAAGSEVPANGRKWELITPGEPVSAQVLSVLPLESDDSRILYTSLGPMPDAVSGVLINTNLAERGENGWNSSPVGFPYSVFLEELLLQLLPVRPLAFSEDRHTSLWFSGVPLTPDSPPEGHGGLYRSSPGGELTLIGDLGEEMTEPFTHISADGKQAIFASSEHLLPGDAGRGEGESIYQWDGAGLRQVDVDSGGLLLSACGSAVSSSGGVSAAGNRIFFTNPAHSFCPETERVYLREGGSSTVEVSASHCTRVDCNPPQNVAFAGATGDGAHVFLTTTQQLTDADLDETPDLYRFDVDSETLTLLTPAQPEAEGRVGAYPVYASPDGMRVYFKAIGRLVTGVGPESGESLLLADQSGLHFVAPTSSENRVELARNGRSALFATAGAMTGDDTDGREDVYLYNADDSTYTRLSAGPSGGNGPFDASIDAPLEKELALEEQSTGYHSIAEDGQDVFFSTAEKLIAADVNEITDVYEWKEGHLGLVSSGTGGGNTSFGGVSADGRTALFKTNDSLTSGDRDGGDGDLYVARIGGGFPPERQTPPPCEGVACDGSEREMSERSLPFTAFLPVKRQRGRIKLRSIRLHPGARSDAASTISVKATVPSPGRVAAVLWMPRAGEGPKKLAGGAAGAIRPGKVRILLRLTSAGHRVATRGQGLSGRLVVSEGKRRLVQSVRLRPGAAK